MKFSDLRDNMTKQNNQPMSMADYQRQYLNDDHRQNIDAIKDRCVYYLFEDLAKIKSKQDFEQYLGNLFYHSSNGYANECVEMAFHSNHIFGRKIRPWTDSALKCFDNFLIRYINEILQEKITKFGDKPKERDVYTHLINKGGVEYEVGVSFESIYQARNSFTHVQIEESEGIRKPVSWSTKKFNRQKELILAQFGKGLKNLEVLLSRKSMGVEA